MLVRSQVHTLVGGYNITRYTCISLGLVLFRTTLSLGDRLKYIGSKYVSSLLMMG